MPLPLALSGTMGGMSLAHRWEGTTQWKSTLRGDFLYDATQAISPKFTLLMFNVTLRL